MTQNGGQIDLESCFVRMGKINFIHSRLVAVGVSSLGLEFALSSYQRVQILLHTVSFHCRLSCEVEKTGCYMCFYHFSSLIDSILIFFKEYLDCCVETLAKTTLRPNILHIFIYIKEGVL